MTGWSHGVALAAFDADPISSNGASKVMLPDRKDGTWSAFR
jgi:hypothetical protein